MSKAITCTLIASLVFLFVGAALAEKEEIVSKEGNLVTIRVTGTGADKDIAELDAKRRAVEKGAGSIIYSDTKVKDFTLMKDTILARSTGFIQSSRVLGTKEMEDGTFEVRIEAVVSVKGVEDVWGTVKELLKTSGTPKIMVFVNEKLDRESVELSTVQTKIEDELLKSGFLLVDRDQMKEIDKKDMNAALSEDKPEKAMAIAKRFGAQIFIKGTSNAARGNDKSIGGVAVATYEAESNVRVFRTDDGQLMGSVAGEPTRGVQQVPRSAAKQALDAQARRVAPELRWKILGFWQDALEGRGEVKLEISDITFKQSRTVEKAIRKIRGVNEVTFGEFNNNNIEARIQSSIKAKELAGLISDAIESLEIESYTANVIKAKFKKE